MPRGMKTCISCETSKKPDEFYAHPKSADRLMGVCKECHKQRMWSRRRTNPAVQAYDRLRYQSQQHRREITAIRSKQWRIDNPEGYKAHTAVGNAIRDGRLKKSPCSVCGSEKYLHAHHEDYSRPLEVTWLCATHHHRHHHHKS